MVTSVLTLTARAGRSGALEDLYAQRGVLERAARFPGCRGATLLRSTDDGPATHLVIADWDDAAAYAGWVADPWRATVAEELSGLLELSPGSAVVAGLYEAVASPPSGQPTPEEIP